MPAKRPPPAKVLRLVRGEARPKPAAPSFPPVDFVAGSLALGDRDADLREAIDGLSERVEELAAATHPAPSRGTPGAVGKPLTVTEAAAKLGVDCKSLYGAIERGEFWPAERIGRRLVVPRAAFDAWCRGVRRVRDER